MQSIEDILKRNSKVELDKAWETSKTRRAVIAGITYTIAALFMYRIGIDDYLVNALVPTGGYLLSTLSLPFVKGWWLKRVLKNQRD
jgi:biotin transporter BioY